MKEELIEQEEWAAPGTRPAFLKIGSCLLGLGNKQVWCSAVSLKSALTEDPTKLAESLVTLCHWQLITPHHHTKCLVPLL